MYITFNKLYIFYAQHCTYMVYFYTFVEVIVCEMFAKWKNQHKNDIPDNNQH